MKRKIYLALAIVLMVSCKENKTEQNVTPVVEVTKVKQMESSSDLQYSGTVEAFQVIPLSFQTQGTVKNVMVNVGDNVKAGQLLATVDKNDAQNAYNLMLSKYQQAKDAYNRLKEVHEKGSLPEVKWVEMESNMQQAQSSLELAKNSLNKCNLTAPESGFVGKRNIEPGMSTINILNSPIELVKINKVFVKISVSENEINQIKKGMKANFSISALNGKRYQGIVSNVGVVADQMSRTYEVKILVNNPLLELKPGMVCDVKIASDISHQTNTIPCMSVDKDSNGNVFVYVLNENEDMVSKRIIKIGNYQGNNIEVLSGLNLDEKVVSNGIHKIADKSKVKVR